MFIQIGKAKIYARLIQKREEYAPLDFMKI
jgi:hypothetical protein